MSRWIQDLVRKLNPEEHERTYGKPTGPKVHRRPAKRTSVNGKHFPSMLEAALYESLLMRQKAGELGEIRLQHAVTLKGACPECGAREVRWKVDFSAPHLKSGRTWFFEAKGEKSREYLYKVGLWRKAPPDRLEIWMGSAERLKLVEVIG